ncbi:hypothetical protein [Psychrobacter sp. I-STPA6b]|uniref:hypothetical protein n=1 Tax=Psychrobacter sp. I-STPA6b TaxID=2585718 RepID=UPI001D0C2782|nr:hypothetical protein [Psychrobacter sp. I-STPA6b]
MHPNKSLLLKKMNELILAYADDVVPVDRNIIVNFFKERNIPCRKDYIDFLARFGGNYSYFFRSEGSGYDCTFQEISEIYLEEPPEEMPSNDYALISNHTFADFYFIEYSTGHICQPYSDNEGNWTYEYYSYKDIDSFLWCQLYYTYYKNFTTEIIHHLTDAELNKFFIDYHDYLLVGFPDCTAGNYFKDNRIYGHSSNTNIIREYILSDEFLRKLYK